MTTDNNNNADAENTRSTSTWWKAGAVILLGIAIVLTVVAKNAGQNNSEQGDTSPSVEDTSRASEDTTAQPLPSDSDSSRGTAGAQKGDEAKTSSKQADAEELPPDTVLATVNDKTITVADLEERLQQMPRQQAAMFKKNRHRFLDKLVSRQLLLQKARKADSAQSDDTPTGSDAAQQDEDKMIQNFLQEQVVQDVEVTEEDMKTFYKQNKDQMPAGRSYEDLKSSIRSYARRKEESKAVQQYVEKLRQNADITRNEEWVEAQKAGTAENPLDKALSKDVPVLADFGRGTCTPCKMMKPILKKLKKEYEGRAEILIINIDEYRGLAQRVGVRAIPTQVFYDSSGNEVSRHQGFMPREDMVKRLTDMGVQEPSATEE